MKAKEVCPNQRLRRERELRGWSQSYVAECIHAPNAYYVGRWERGLATPSPYYREKLCALFGQNAYELGFLVDITTSSPARNVVGGLSIPGEQIKENEQHCSLPLLSNPFFTGREGLLAQLVALLQKKTEGKWPPPVALCGLGGIGKTQLALEYAHRQSKKHISVFWITAESEKSILWSFLRIAATLCLCDGATEQPIDKQKQGIEEVKQWLNTHQDWLLIWDQVEDLELLSRYLPIKQDGSILITTRQQAVGTLAVPLEIPPLTKQEALLFLLRRVKLLPLDRDQEHLQQASAEQMAAQQLVEAMGSLPLALDQIGAYMEETKCSFSDYLQMYQRRHKALLQRRGRLALYYPHSVASTWERSFEQIIRQNPAAFDILQVCSLLPLDEFPEELFIRGAEQLGPCLAATVVDAFALNELLSELCAHSLIYRQVQACVFSLHPLVQMVLQERMSDQEQHLWHRRILAALNAAFPAIPPAVLQSLDHWEKMKARGKICVERYSFVER